MITELKGYVNATRATVSRVTALIIVLAIMCAGTAFAATPTTYNVDIYDGSEITRVTTFKNDPKAIVEQAEITLNENDVLKLDEFTVGEDSIIVIYRAADIMLTDIEGNAQSLTFAGTVKDLLEEKGIVLGEELLVNLPLDTVLKNGMNVVIKSAYTITVIADGTSVQLKMGDATVLDALNTAGVTLGENDESDPSADTALYDGIEIRVLRVEYKERTATETIKYSTSVIKSDEMYVGTSKVTQKGSNGKKTVVYADKYVDGKKVGAVVRSETVIKDAVAQVKTVGTKERPKTLTVTELKNGGMPISELTPPSTLVLENGVPASYKSVVTGKAAAYTATGKKTASGVTPKPGYIAVDPKQFPYGTELFIVSTDGIVYGYCIAADTGGFVNKGKFTVDLFMNSSQQCKQWGSRDVLIYVL